MFDYDPRKHGSVGTVQWPPIVDDPTHAPPAPVTRSEFDALKREVEALKAPPTGDFAKLVATFRAYATAKTQQADEQRRAGHETGELVSSMAAMCWAKAADDFEALLKTTE